jgi:hypothetical protein
VFLTQLSIGYLGQGLERVGLITALFEGIFGSYFAWRFSSIEGTNRRATYLQCLWLNLSSYTRVGRRLAGVVLFGGGGGGGGGSVFPVFQLNELQWPLFKGESLTLSKL